MLPKAFTKSALVVSLLLGTSALGQAQTHQGSAASATDQTESSATATPSGTQAGPRKAEPHHAVTTKSSETTPNQPGTTKPSEVGQNQPGTPGSSEAAPNQASKTRSSEVGSNEPGMPARQGNSTVGSTTGRTSGRSGMANNGNSTEQGKASATLGAGGNNTNASSLTSSTGTTNLTTTQKTEIRKTIVSDDSAPRANNVNINLSVGVAVPPTVKFAPIPPKIVSIEPAWRGYEYFLYGDEVVIIEPGTRRVVAILVG